MNNRLKTIIKRTVIVATCLLLLLRGYRELVPAGAKSTAYILASVDGGTITSPNGSEYAIHFNDAGSMHSGNHWTWVVDYNWLTGLRVKTAGYLGAEYAVDREQIPIEWDGEDPILTFENGRYE